MNHRLKRWPAAHVALALCLALASHTLVAGCASTTMITTHPEGARVYVNGQYFGRSPVLYSDTRIAGSTNFVRLELEGYAPEEYVFERNERIDAGALVAGLFFLVPLLWVTGYQPHHAYELRPLGGIEVYEEEYYEVEPGPPGTN